MITYREIQEDHGAKDNTLSAALSTKIVPGRWFSPAENRSTTSLCTTPTNPAQTPKENPGLSGTLPAKQSGAKPAPPAHSLPTR